MSFKEQVMEKYVKLYIVRLKNKYPVSDISVNQEKLMYSIVYIDLKQEAYRNENGNL